MPRPCSSAHIALLFRNCRTDDRSFREGRTESEEGAGGNEEFERPNDSRQSPFFTTNHTHVRQTTRRTSADAPKSAINKPKTRTRCPLEEEDVREKANANHERDRRKTPRSLHDIATSETALDQAVAGRPERPRSLNYGREGLASFRSSLSSRSLKGLDRSRNRIDCEENGGAYARHISEFQMDHSFQSICKDTEEQNTGG